MMPELTWTAMVTMTKMSEIIHHPSSIIHREKGVALLMVLLILIAITVISLGFLTRCDTELACGQNMLLRTQMDQLADSALEHARGLVLQPQDAAWEYWTGAQGQQLMAESSDYYDVNVARDESNPNERRNYSIRCEAYRWSGTQKIGISRLAAQLRLDPCAALWTGGDTLWRPRQALYGDLYCRGAVTNLGTINGDVFSDALTGSVAGRRKATTDLSLPWPPVTSAYTSPEYGVGFIGPGPLAATTYQPARVWHYTGDLVINNNVTIQGMLLVDGSLVIRGNTNVINAAKNLPALYVNGDLVIEEIDTLRIEGLAVVEGAVRVSARASNVRILGGLFVKGTLVELAPDSSASHCDCLVYDAPTWRPTGGARQGALEFDGVNDFLRTPDGLSLQLAADYTMSLWIKPAASQKAWAGILAKTDASGTTNHWALQFNANSPRELVVFHGSQSWATGITMADMATPDTWYHVAVVRQGNKMSSYIGGAVRKNGDTWDVGPGSGIGHLNIAADRTADVARLYTGQIDDVRVYSQAVAVPPPDGVPSLIGHWKLDESGSDVAIVAEPARSAIVAFGSPEIHWSQAAGAFYRSIRRD
jgi:cytoskeletal protein CcmA (bactofilin family)